MHYESKSWYSKLTLLSLIITTVGGALAIAAYVKSNKKCAQLNGLWTVTFRVNESTYKSYINDVYVYEVYVNQIEDQIKGNGEQTLYNGSTAKKHFKLEWGKTQVGDKLCIPYKLHGTRPTSGIMELAFNKDDEKRLTGTFAGAAADTKGTVEVVIE